MDLGLTMQVQKQMQTGVRPVSEGVELAYCWDMNLIRWERKTGLVVSNASNRLAIYLHGMKRAEWKRFPELMMEQIERALRQADLPEEWVERYMEEAGPPELTKTHGRRSLGALTDMIRILPYGRYSPAPIALAQPHIERALDRVPCRAAGFPGEGMGSVMAFVRRDFERLFGGA